VVLYERYMEPLAQFALHLTGDPSVAEDITAHVLATVWLRRDRWAVHNGIDAYLFGAIRNRAISFRHSAARHDRIERALAATDWSPTTGAPPGAPDAALEEMDWSDRLSAAMQQLPDRYGQVAFLRWKRGLEYDQIALILSISDGTARQLVSRTLRALRAILGA
jgi:RNA polymerase sigma-70 factor (ECF subfamily)